MNYLFRNLPRLPVLALLSKSIMQQWKWTDESFSCVRKSLISALIVSRMLSVFRFLYPSTEPHEHYLINGKGSSRE